MSRQNIFFGSVPGHQKRIAVPETGSSGTTIPNHNFLWNPYELQARGIPSKWWWTALCDGEFRKGSGIGPDFSSF